MCSKGGAFDTRRRGFSHKQVGLLTQDNWLENSNQRLQGNAVRKRPARLIYSNTYLHRDHVFSLKKRKVAATGYNDRYNPVCTLSDLLRTRKFLQVLTISPRICRACRPTPCPHFACNADA